MGKLNKSTYGIGPQTQIVAGLSLLFFQTCSCHLILETVLKWFLQGTDEAKPHILLRKKLDDMTRCTGLFLWLMMSLSILLPVILHCESLADELVIGVLSCNREEKHFSEQQWDFKPASPKTSVDTDADGPVFVRDMSRFRGPRDMRLCDVSNQLLTQIFICSDVNRVVFSLPWMQVQVDYDWLDGSVRLGLHLKEVLIQFELNIVIPSIVGLQLRKSNGWNLFPI